MDFEDLRCFIAVYEAKGCGRASRRLGTVPSTISYRIRGLERSLGVRLFERRWRRFVPTESGERLYPAAREILAALEQAGGRSLPQDASSTTT